MARQTSQLSLRNSVRINIATVPTAKAGPAISTLISSEQS